ASGHGRTNGSALTPHALLARAAGILKSFETRRDAPCFTLRLRAQAGRQGRAKRSTFLAEGHAPRGPAPRREVSSELERSKAFPWRLRLLREPSDSCADG